MYLFLRLLLCLARKSYCNAWWSLFDVRSWSSSFAEQSCPMSPESVFRSFCPKPMSLRPTTTVSGCVTVLLRWRFSASVHPTTDLHLFQRTCQVCSPVFTQSHMLRTFSELRWSLHQWHFPCRMTDFLWWRWRKALAPGQRTRYFIWAIPSPGLSGRLRPWWFCHRWGRKTSSPVERWSTCRSLTHRRERCCECWTREIRCQGSFWWVLLGNWKWRFQTLWLLWNRWVWLDWMNS